ncbi:general substrate transporter [Radiomyces spectabilis]|uniref:general substrate transporter n=1 Tax=Radiomyces spectabilis TaxID=64574 RepID=UPI00221FF4C8|nr:general substrate transporter [Radiomyces spectabilis]KAI8391384.1 general substrate transporter [Radiomyces spectabilis]
MPQNVISKCEGGMDSPNNLPACLPMSDTSWGFTVGAFALGGLAGSLSTMYLNHWFGRRDNIMIACGWMILGGILSATSINIGMYSIGRAFVGIAAGMSGSSVAIYVSEISTKKSRGALGSLFELFLNLGILLTQVCGLYMKFVPVWRLLWAIPSIIAFIQLVLLFFITVECPRRLCVEGKYDQARVALQKLRGNANVDEEFANMVAARQREAEGQPRMSMLDIILFKDRHITWNTIIVMVLQAYNQVGGIGPMSVYSVNFLTSIFNGDQMLGTDVSLANATGNIVATFIAVIFMHRVGRKGFMLISTGGMCITSIMIVVGSAAPQAAKLGPLVITAALCFTFTYSMGCGVIPWLIAPELLPMHALPPGSALGNASNWLLNFVINTVWPVMNANLKEYSFTVFAAINFVGFVFIFFCMPETTGKDLDHHHKKDRRSTIGDLESKDDDPSSDSGTTGQEISKSYVEQLDDTRRHQE